MRGKGLIGAVTVASIGVLLLAAIVVIYSEFGRFQAQVAALQRRLPETERNLPVNVKRVFRRLSDEEVNRWVARNLLWSVTPRTRMLRWHLRSSLWERLLPYWYARGERESFFAHFLVAEDANGLEQVSWSLFGKSPSELSQDEVIGLLTVLRNPKRFSPTRAPAEYERELQQEKKRLGAV